MTEHCDSQFLFSNYWIPILNYLNHIYFLAPYKLILNIYLVSDVFLFSNCIVRTFLMLKSLSAPATILDGPQKDAVS